MAKLFTRLITSFIILIIVALLALLIGVRSQTTTATLPCIDGEEREYIRVLTLDAIDRAYQTQVAHLFEVFMKDPNPTQYKRTQSGMTLATSAHIKARQDTLKWNPPRCQ